MKLRKQFALALAALSVLTLGADRADAQLLAYEGFDYAAEGGLTGFLGSNGGTGFDGPWSDGLAASNSATQIVSGSLSSTSFPGLTTNGNSFSFQGQDGNTRVFRDLSLTGSLAPFVDEGFIGGGTQDGALYVSFLMGHQGDDDFNEISVTQTSIFEVGRGDLSSASNAAFTAGVDAAGGFPQQRAVTNKTATGQFPLPGPTSSIDLIVLEVDFVANGDDTLNIYVNPTATTQPGSPDGTLTGNFAFDRIGFGGFQQSPAAFFDEFRLGTSYADVFAAAPVLGDVDGNGLVEIDDFEDIRDNYFATGAGSVFGEAVGAIDGKVNIQDFVIWKREFELAGNSAAGLSLFGNQVPEPASVLIFACGIGIAAAIRRSGQNLV